MLSLWSPFYDDFYGSVGRNRKKLFDTNYHWDIEYKKKDDNSLAVSVDLPGIEEQDVSVEVTSDNILQIRGERKTSTSSYTVTKSFLVPEVYDADNIKAELKNGVLTLTLPPKQVVKDIKKIAITSVK